ncbi:hypothetical protein PFICI_13861 [Pestalotiopsis fici W106-1]|uniref:beta-glucosidase n=1 Tax=Pestalotiopsis fici (strain W106-1 / CGMCC3.15140) TaxID=1229662 RepID=W3WJ89_PESFW|nr:uncharacterized protein PFICI_13861 [Pestalotiopsis fici W106-1]ETS73995.1 hypothetical protein PFICI_13861 [Pestalotiopsis fici W106-1]
MLSRIPLASVLGLALTGIHTAAAYNITDDTVFYGQSPAVYPSPNGTGADGWADAYQKARAMVSQLTVEEKVNITISIPQYEDKETGCEGRVVGIPRVGFPGLCLADAGHGLRNAEFVSGWPIGLSLGASWNRELVRQKSVGMAAEFKKKGINVIFGPVIGPQGKIAKGGRNWEGFSSDPWHTGQLAYESVQGIHEAGVIASVKHFVANEQETRRSTSTFFYEDSTTTQAISSNVDDKTMHELYVWPFVDALHAGAANIMCSYNRLNNSYGCQNSKMMNGVLKTELGFQGFVITDWGAQHAGVATALAGMDSAALPEGGDYGTMLWGQNLTLAVQNGSVPETRLDDMVTRTLAAWYKLGQDQDFPAPGSGFPADHTLPHVSIDARDPAYDDVLLQGAVEGHVLVKNIGNALPLKKPKMLGIYGYSARSRPYFQPNDVLGPLLTDDHALDGVVIDVNGTIYSGGGSGATSPWLAVSPWDTLLQRARHDRTALYWDFESANPQINANIDACLVMVNAYATEGTDRDALRDDYTDSLILNVAKNCTNTIVVFHNLGARLVDTFVDHPNVTAIIFAHGPGQESGNALVSLLYGDVNFSGKMPYTVAKNESDYGDLLNPRQGVEPYYIYPQDNFTEGVFIDYKAFDKDNIEPRYEFGFGLSYTTFNYTGLTITKKDSTDLSQYPTGEVLQGGPSDLWDIVATVTATVTNTGGVSGAEVAQLYLGLPGDEDVTPVRQLRGFEKPFLYANQSVIVSFPLTRRDLSFWDVVAQKWSLVSGDVAVEVGSSSRKLPLTGTLTL